jgi:hypothetical protein
MPSYIAKRNIRANGKRYLAGQVYDIDAATAKLNDNFELHHGTVTHSKPQESKSAAKPSSAIVAADKKSESEKK